MAKKRKKNEYWTVEQEDAVKVYLQLDPESRQANKIFEDKLYDPIRKLVENILFTYHLTIPEIPVEEQILDAMGFIAFKMHKFDPDKGHKAFSYYGTIAKNYMIAKQNKHYNKKIQSVDISAILGFEFEQELYEDHESEQEYKSKGFLFTVVADDIEEMAKSNLRLDDNTRKLSEAIVFLLRNYQNVNVHNKRQFYFIAREFTGMNAKEITRSLGKIKEVYQRSRKSLQ